MSRWLSLLVLGCEATTLTALRTESGPNYQNLTVTEVIVYCYVCG